MPAFRAAHLPTKPPISGIPVQAKTAHPARNAVRQMVQCRFPRISRSQPVTPAFLRYRASELKAMGFNSHREYLADVERQRNERESVTRIEVVDL